MRLSFESFWLKGPAACPAATYEPAMSAETPTREMTRFMSDLPELAPTIMTASDLQSRRRQREAGERPASSFRPRSMRRLRERNEWKFVAVLPKADVRLAAAWWTILVLRGILPAL